MRHLFFLNSDVFCFRQTVPFFFKRFRAVFYAFSFVDITGNPHGNTPCNFIRTEALSQGLQEARGFCVNSSHSSTHIPIKDVWPVVPRNSKRCIQPSRVFPRVFPPFPASFMTINRRLVLFCFVFFFHPRAIDSILVVRKKK